MKSSYQAGSAWLNLLIYVILSAYIVYEQATDSNAVTLSEQVARHQRMLEGNSEFFNPWQYRILSTYVVEGFYQVVAGVFSSIDRIPAFLAFRFLQNVLIFFVAELFMRSLGLANPWLRLTGQLLLAFSMSHSVFQSDLSFNTYFDVLFYLLAGWLIIQKRNAWLVPLMAVAALNRETAALIPVMFLVPYIDWKEKKVPSSILRLAVLLGVVFVVAFAAVRMFFGYQVPIGIHGMHTVGDYLLFNLSFFRMYPELIGTLAFLPLFVPLFLDRLPPVLRQWFWVVCPIWFVVHFAYSTAVETRLFLVPMAVVLIPAFLFQVEGWYSDNKLRGQESQEWRD